MMRGLRTALGSLDGNGAKAESKNKIMAKHMAKAFVDKSIFNL